MKVPCSVCQRPKSIADCESITITEEERQSLVRMGEPEPPSIFYYCRPCFRLLNDRSSASALMRGVVRSYAKSVGASNADDLADRFKDRLTAKSKPT